MTTPRSRTVAGAAVLGLLLAGAGFGGLGRSDAAPRQAEAPQAARTTPQPPGAVTAQPATLAEATGSYPVAHRTRWVPRQGMSWQVQYAGPVRRGESARVLDVDGVETSARQVAQWHAQGKKVVCYVNAGGWERWRPDAGRFPASVRGHALDGWPGEQWLDVRRRNVLLPIMARRFDECARKGFDAVDPDNVDGYDNDTGFRISGADQLAYVRALAVLAHRRGMSMSLKNATGLMPYLTRDVDFAVNEECHENEECGDYSGFVRRGKAVVEIEYEGSRSSVCSRVPRGFSRMIKRETLDSWTVRC